MIVHCMCCRMCVVVEALMPSPPPAVIADRDSGGLNHLEQLNTRDRTRTATGPTHDTGHCGTGPTHKVRYTPCLKRTPHALGHLRVARALLLRVSYCGPRRHAQLRHLLPPTRSAAP
eukprot:scaffold31691_cov70-Phaeocystis_antarctica.AAC.1